MKPKTLLVLVGALVVAAILAVHRGRKLAATQQALAALASLRHVSERNAVVMEQRLAAASNALIKLQHEEAALAGLTGATSGSATLTTDQLGAKPTAGRKLSPASLVASDPGKMAEYAKNYRQTLDLTLGGMFKKLGLSAEQIEKVKDLTVWREQGRMDLESAAEARGLDLQGEAYQKMRWDLLENGGKKEAEILGSTELLDSKRSYSRLGYLRNTVQRIASSEMGSETPATFAQVERAIDIVAANSQRRDPKNPERWEYGWSWPDWATINWAVAEPQLQGVLSPAQYSALREFLRTQETWTTIAARNAANQAEARRLVRQPGG